MKIFIITAGTYDLDNILLVTSNAEKAKGFICGDNNWVDVWENEEQIDSLRFEKFKEKY